MSCFIWIGLVFGALQATIIDQDGAVRLTEFERANTVLRTSRRVDDVQDTPPGKGAPKGEEKKGDETPKEASSDAKPKDESKDGDKKKDESKDGDKKKDESKEEDAKDESKEEDAKENKPEVKDAAAVFVEVMKELEGDAKTALSVAFTKFEENAKKLAGEMPQKLAKLTETARKEFEEAEAAKADMLAKTQALQEKSQEQLEAVNEAQVVVAANRFGESHADVPDPSAAKNAEKAFEELGKSQKAWVKDNDELTKSQEEARKAYAEEEELVAATRDAAHAVKETFRAWFALLHKALSAEQAEADTVTHQPLHPSKWPWSKAEAAFDAKPFKAEGDYVFKGKDTPALPEIGTLLGQADVKAVYDALMEKLVFMTERLKATRGQIDVAREKTAAVKKADEALLEAHEKSSDGMEALRKAVAVESERQQGLSAATQAVRDGYEQVTDADQGSDAESVAKDAGTLIADNKAELEAQKKRTELTQAAQQQQTDVGRAVELTAACQTFIVEPEYGSSSVDSSFEKVIDRFLEERSAEASQLIGDLKAEVGKTPKDGRPFYKWKVVPKADQQVDEKEEEAKKEEAKKEEAKKEEERKEQASKDEKTENEGGKEEKKEEKTEEEKKEDSKKEEKSAQGVPESPAKPTAGKK